jgi:hypothetical protein
MGETEVRDEAVLPLSPLLSSFPLASQSSQRPANAEPTEEQNDGNNYSDAGLGSYSG